MSIRIGIDLGGTKIEIIAIDDHGDILVRERQETPDTNYKNIVQVTADLVNKVEALLGEKGTVGVAMPGALSLVTGKIKNSNTACMIGQTFDKDLGEILNRVIRVNNDANCFTISEVIDGAAEGADVVFGVILGTGVGGGIAIDSKIINGINSIAGEWGHNPLPWPKENELPGPNCYCGKQGCIETFLSGPGLMNDYKVITDKKLEPPEIVQQSRGGNKSTIATMERYYDRLARALASVINIIDPDVIVLGGGLSNIEELYEKIPELWIQHVFSDRVDTKLVPAKYGDASGVRGASWLWDN
jgi:predicted NBD/HSP70 family sugar kinase